MTDFLLELRSEEIPARMQVKAKEDLARLFADEIAKAGLAADVIETFATPRRLALIARGLPLETAATSEERKGPRTSAPEAALAGFLRSTGLTREQLTDRDGVFFAAIDKPGRATPYVLADAIPAIVRAFPWPKSMRWGAASASTESLRWVRPLQGIVALFGETIVPLEIDGIEAGATTVGHRFHHPGSITIGSAADYIEKLRLCHVIVHHSERCALIRDGARAAAAAAGLTLVEDEGLVAENAGLTEWPVPLLGRFAPEFLDVPREVIQLTMRTNQKYFACVNPPLSQTGEGDRREAVVEAREQSERGATLASLAPLRQPVGLPPPPGKLGEELANAFVCTANIDAADPAVIVDGNRKVLAARLSDAQFFWENDLKVPLDEQAAKLKDIVFHEKLGTVADKVERVAKLARWLCEEGVVTSSPLPERRRGALPSEAEASDEQSGVLGYARTSPSSALGREKLADLAERAARLCKADLVTGMVGEFPELQGIIGGHLARAQGEPREVWEAIRDHYKPVGQGDEVPTAPVTVAVALADKLDSVFSFFGIQEPPSGSKDPFAIRRSMLTTIRLIEANNLRLRLAQVALASGANFAAQYALTMARYVPGLFFSTDRFMRQSPLADGRTISGVIEIAVAAQNAIMARADNPNDPVWNDQQRQIGWGHRDYVRDQLYISNEEDAASIGFDLLAFAADRLKVQQREAGVRHDLIDAVFALGGEDDLVRLLARVRALQAFVGTEDGAKLLGGYKRAANILKKEGYEAPLPPSREGQGEGPSSRKVVAGVTEGPSPDPSREGGRGGHKPLSYTPETAEAELIAALDSAAPAAATAVAAEDFGHAMIALASLRAPIDAFFETVTVNDPDQAKRGARLALLARVRDAVHQVADFSRIEG